ncbi:MAG: helix-turn-helix domain-containing protein [Thiomicrorhabdus sp.]|nr:helix-turn-helix domain-containing protein [Thiomicrorhabdus sp.]
MTDIVEDSNTQLSKLLILGREQKKMTVQEAADKLNLSSKQLEKLESSDVNPQELTTFERGYLRNYAALLEVDLQEFETYFPEGKSVGSELQSIQRDNFKTTKPVMNQLWVRVTLFIVVLGLIVWLLFTLGADFSQVDLNRTLEQATEMTLPNPEQ